MTKKFVQRGDILNLAPGADVASGVGYLFGTTLFGIAAADVANGVEGSFFVEGVHEIGKTSALAISVGDALYWDATNKVVNKTTSSQRLVGVAVTAASNPSSTVWIKLNGASQPGT
jgi:predicted RecA/RadA family phage recombinase